MDWAGIINALFMGIAAVIGALAIFVPIAVAGYIAIKTYFASTVAAAAAKAVAPAIGPAIAAAVAPLEKKLDAVVESTNGRTTQLMAMAKAVGVAEEKADQEETAGLAGEGV